MKNGILSKFLFKFQSILTPYLFDQIDKNEIPNTCNEIRLFVIARNESLRLPYFLDYYLKNGVDRIFLIDNDSTDQTVKVALSYEKVHVFQTNQEYKTHWFWMEYFLNNYGKDSWCVVVDIDELLYYPYAEKINLKLLTRFLEKNGFTAFRSLLLDIYSDKPISKTLYTAGDNPLVACPYFDKEYNIQEVSIFDRQNWQYFKTIVFNGGMRERVFGGNLPNHLSKISVFKNINGSYLTQGMHALNNGRIANIQGVVFHSKFLDDFLDEVKSEVERKQHFGNAILYKIFNEEIQKKGDLLLYHKESIKFENWEQLLRLGIIHSSKNFDEYAENIY